MRLLEVQIESILLPDRERCLRLLPDAVPAVNRLAGAAVRVAAALCFLFAGHGASHAEDCQDACLAACPKRSGPFGSPELDRACVQKCLLLQCNDVSPPTGGELPRPASPDGSIELVLNTGGEVRALSRGPFTISAAALPVGGTFKWQIDATDLVDLRDAGAPAQGLYPMPRSGLSNAAASARRAIPLKPGRVQVSVEYDVRGKKSSSKATIDILPPLVFLHGIASNAATWDAVKERLEQSKLVFGGKLCATCPPVRPADFYTADFRYPQESYIRQKDDVAAYIRQVTALVPAEAKPEGKRVVLVAHSMGGLASRAYLQSGSYRKDVAALITVGTPHRGSIAAQFVYPVVEGTNPAPAYVNETLYRDYWLPLKGGQVAKPLIQAAIRHFGIDLDLSSEGVRELAVVTNDMKALNANVASLPRDVRYVFVVGTLPAETAHEILSNAWVQRFGMAERNDVVFNTLKGLFERTDVLVDEGSQNLNTLVPGLGQVIRTKAIHCCWAKGLNGLPLNETDQTDVIFRALAATGYFDLGGRPRR